MPGSSPVAGVGSSPVLAASSSRRSALVLFGSETGNAEDVAVELSRVVQRLHFSSHVIPLDAVDPSLLNHFTVVLVALCTAGQGDLPAGSRTFWGKLLRKKLSSVFLDRVNFAVFGLGDRSYPRYNWAAKKLHKRLLQLGAQPVVVLGEGDEQQAEGYETALLPWIAGLRQRILQQYPSPEGLDPIPDQVLLPPPWTLALRSPVGGTETLQQTSKLGGQSPSRGFRNCSPWMGDGAIYREAALSQSRINVMLARNQRVTPTTHWQDVRHLLFSAADTLDYGPGDTLTIYPHNDLADVKQLVTLMAWEDVADLPLTVHTNEPHGVFPPPLVGIWSETLTLNTLLAQHLDLNGIPRRSFFSLISHFTNDEFQKARLLEFANPAFIDELHDYTTRPRRSILEVLQEFDSVKIPWPWALHVLPLLRGRQFSIASGGSLKHAPGSATTFELLVAIVQYRTVIRKMRRGVCTRYLDSMAPGRCLQVALQKGGLGSAILDPSRPVVLIGPGTGVAPIRSVIWERHARMAERNVHGGGDLRDGRANEPTSDQLPAETVLFFGGRNQSADYFFHGEWEELQSQMPLHVFTAFSRDQRPKRYVQDAIREQHELVFRLLHDDHGIVLVCGSSGRMPDAVREALVDVFTTRAVMDRGAAVDYLKMMEQAGRYKQETW